MYVPLPQDLLQHVHPQLYFPYFGSLRTATHATFGINCGPPEFDYDSLGLRASDWTVTMSADDTSALIQNPSLTMRQRYYFAYGRPQTPAGLGHPHPSGFWSFFNCGAPANWNPFHRNNYFTGALAHVDAVPWATLERWANVDHVAQNHLKELALPIFRKTLETGLHIQRILIRGITATEFLINCGVGLELYWVTSRARPTFQFGRGQMRLNNQRTIDVIALNQFNNLPQDVGQELLPIISDQ